MEVFISEIPENASIPLPVENDICFCFSVSDFPISLGEKPIVYIEFSADTIADDGTVFNLLGNEFSVDYSSLFTESSFNVSSNGAFLKALAFQAMVQQSFYFKDMIVEIYSQGANYIVSIEYNQVGVYSGLGIWDFSFSDFTVPPNVIIVPGSNPDYGDDFKILYQLQHEENGVYVDTYPVQYVKPSVLIGTNTVVPVCVNFKDELSKLVKTTIPQLDDLDFFDETISRNFRISFGSVQNSEGCSVKFDKWSSSAPYETFNAGFQLNDFIGIDRHFYQSENSYKIEFLSLMPKNHCICENTKFWLWCYVNNGRVVAGQQHGYSAKFTFYEDNVLISTITQDVGEVGASGFLVIGAGPGNGLVTFPSNANSYCVELIAGSLGSQRTTTPSSSFATEPKCFKISSSCCSDFNIHFLCHKGGYDIMTELTEIAYDFETEMQEVCTGVVCSHSNDIDTNLLEGGKFMYGGKSFEKIALETQSYQKTDERLEFFKSFKASESMYTILTNSDGQEYRQRVLIEAGSIRIWEKDSKIKVSLSAYFNTDYIHQSRQ